VPSVYSLMEGGLERTRRRLARFRQTASHEVLSHGND